MRTLSSFKITILRILNPKTKTITIPLARWPLRNILSTGKATSLPAAIHQILNLTMPDKLKPQQQMVEATDKISLLDKISNNIKPFSSIRLQRSLEEGNNSLKSKSSEFYNNRLRISMVPKTHRLAFIINIQGPRVKLIIHSRWLRMHRLLGRCTLGNLLRMLRLKVLIQPIKLAYTN